MARIIPLKLNRNGKQKQARHDEGPPTVAERMARLREELDGLERLAKEQAAARDLPSFMGFESVLKEKLDAVGRATTELFLTQAEERVGAASKDGVWCGDRFLRPAPEPHASSQGHAATCGLFFAGSCSHPICRVMQPRDR